MKLLNVYIEIGGKMTKAGSLSGDDYTNAYFSYDDNYLTSKKAKAISISLPLEKRIFGVDETKAYFESLLPEGFTRRAVANWAKVNEEDYVSILEHLGKECIGAIQVSKEENYEAGGYKLLNDIELMALAKEGATKSSEILMESHISLAGATGKVGLYYDDLNNKWYKPYGVAASTHIVKQSHVRLEQIVLNEQLCMLTASKLGIEIPKSFIISGENFNSEEMLFATERYDRIRIKRGDRICSPYRLHQEDFAQALGILASEKYEIENRQYLRKMFDLIENYSSNPLEDALKLWDRIIFNYLVGNTDAHIKNYGLLYNENLDYVRLCPAYDIVCTRIYGKRDDMSVMINGVLDCTKLRREDFLEASKELMIGHKIAMAHFDYLNNNLEKAIRQSMSEIKETGFEEVVGLEERILNASMIN